MVEIMPERDKLYCFIKENYIHSRFEGSPDRKDHPDYPDIIIDGYMKSLLEDGVANISPFESRTGKFIQFNRGLNIINPDIPLEELHRNFGNISHLLGA